MIKIENVSMKFNLEIEKDFSMKQAFVNLFTKKKKKKKNEDFWALKDVSFNIPINVFPTGGIAMRMACGKIIRRIACQGVIPVA